MNSLKERHCLVLLFWLLNKDTVVERYRSIPGGIFFLSDLCYNAGMRKLSAGFFIFFFCSLLFAGQPFFLQNWIIPDDFVWSNNVNLKEIPGKTFYQRMSDKYNNSYITFYSKKKSNIDMPPYFVENDLLGWDKTYAEILAAFEGNDQFFTYAYVYPSLKKENLSDEINFLDIIRIVCRQDDNFELEIYFPHTKTERERNEKKPDYVYIYYFKDGLTKSELNIPQEEFFKEKYLSQWQNYSQEEKAILTLSYYAAKNDNFLPSDYDCTVLINNKKTDPVAYLKSVYSIENKEQLLHYVEIRRDNTIIPNYYEFINDIDSNPGKEIVNIGNEKLYDVPNISRMFFVQNMRDNIGKHGVDIYLDSTYLYIYRLAVGAGYMTREESVQYCMPIVKKLLSQYTSFEDYSAHLAASYSFLGVKTGVFASWVTDIMKHYNNATKYIAPDEIKFNGSVADKPITFDDAYYKPTGEALWWCRVQREFEKLTGEQLPTVKYEMSKYEDVLCLKLLITKINPKQYDESGSETYDKFYQNNYKKIWSDLPENEKYAIAFSSNLFELNRQYHHDFEGRVTFGNKSSDPKSLLKDSWSIESYDNLIDMYNSLEEYGHSGAYKSLCNLLDKYPGQSPAVIASKESLSMLDTTRLYFANETRDILGEHGIEAWDEGREITILRWGIAAGYISSDEAMKLIVPVIKRIRQNYVSFQDYMSHYIMGRQFYSLYDGSYEKRGKDAKAASQRVNAYIPVNELVFTAENADQEHVMNYLNCLLEPSDALLVWQKIIKLYQEDYSEETIAQLEQYEQELPESKNALFSWHLYLLYQLNKYDQVIALTEQSKDFLESLPKDGELYSGSIYYYLVALNRKFEPEKVLDVLSTLPESLQTNIYFYSQYAYALYYMMNLCSTQAEFNVYKTRAKEAFMTLKYYDYQLTEIIENWLKVVQ